MGRQKRFTSKAPIDTMDDARSFVAHLSKAFAAHAAGASASAAFSEFIASLGYFPIDGDQWIELREEFIEVAEDVDGEPEAKVVVLMDERCAWLESDFIRQRRAAEKRPIPRDGKQPPKPSPFAQWR